jgi:uncharacterized protein YndB with AHSA1/START domain
MNHDLVVSQTISINAPVAQVWEALTNPALIKLYLFGTNTTTDWKVGSGILFQGEYEGQVYTDKGIVRENIPNSSLSYSYWSGFSGAADVPENYSLVTYTLKPTGDNTTDFTWTQRGFATTQGYEHSLNGMGEFLASIKKVVEEM